MEQLELDDIGLKSLVDAFYARVRADIALGPIFNDAIGDWPEHLEKLAAFWSSVMLTSGRYKGTARPRAYEAQGADNAGAVRALAHALGANHRCVDGPRSCCCAAGPRTTHCPEPATCNVLPSGRSTGSSSAHRIAGAVG